VDLKIGKEISSSAMQNPSDTDATVLASSIEEIKEKTNVETVIADGAYVSSSVRDKTKDLEVEFIATAIRGKESEKEIDSLSFELNKDDLIEKCPNTQISNLANARFEIK
jgi:hypothetical protein